MTSIYNNIPLKLNIPLSPNLSFRGINTGNILPSTKIYPSQDSYSSNPLNTGYFSEEQILAEVKTNPNIQAVLNKNNMPVKLNMKELESLKKGHLLDTRILVAKIHSALPAELKSETNTADLQQAAMFHDYGKVLIPKEILNKPGSLTDEEHEIMNQHSVLGYELLKNSALSDEVLEIIKNHHTPGENIGAQIVNIADKYSALTETRCYKDALSKEEALAIIEKDVQDGIIRPEIFETLKKIV